MLLYNIFLKFVFDIHVNFRPDKIDLSKVDYRTNRENLQIAFNFAESEFGITKILDPEDLDCGTVDEKSVITYISMLYNTMPFIPVLPSQFHVESVIFALLTFFF